MIAFEQIDERSILFQVDLSIYKPDIISKTVYWLADEFLVYTSQDNNIQEIKLEKKEGIIDETMFTNLRNKINQDLIDFSLRDIINDETKDIRNILYIKAFAHNDVFEDFYLSSN